MARVTKSVTAKARHNKVLSKTKGYYGARSRLYKTAKQSNIKSMQYAFRDRKNRKRAFRSLWVARINAGSRELGVSYSKLISSMTQKNIKLDKEVLDILISGCGGDIRKAIDTYELAVMSIDTSKNKIVSKELIKELLENNSIYDKQSDNHYNNISAFIKSIRGSDPDAAIYYLARMLKNGEDPLFIARRLIISASEDIGLANPNAMIIANSTFESVNKIGMPEGRIPLANATIYLSLSEKSNSSYKAINEAYEEVSNNPITEVPIHLMNAETKIDEEFGVGKGYEYDHNSEDGFIKQDNFPKKLSNRKFYNPIGRGIEKTLKDRFEKLWLKD